VGPQQLKEGAVEKGKVAAGAIGAQQLAAGSVTPPALAASAVTPPALAASAVTSAALAPEAVTSSVLAPEAVIGTKIASSSVLSTKLAPEAVLSSKLAPEAVTSSALAPESVLATKLAPSSVLSTKLAPEAVLSSKLAPEAVTATALASNAVTGPKINANAVTTPKISEKSVGTAQISNAIPSASAAKSTDTSRSNGGFSALHFPTETFDTANLHGGAVNDALMKAPVAGIYQITATVTWANDGCLGTRSLEVDGFEANGTTPFLPNPFISSTVPASSTSTTTQTLTGMIQLDAGEFAYILGGASMPSCSTTNILGSPASSLTMTWIAPG
jgi:hypothetical protein